MNAEQNSSPINRRTLVIAILALAAVLIAVAIGVAAVRGTRPPLAERTPSPAAQPTCAPSGCALVSTTYTTPRTIVFYGASCSGAHGSWFLNVVEGGGNSELRPSYSLRWTFAAGSTIARPSGTVTM